MAFTLKKMFGKGKDKTGESSGQPTTLPPAPRPRKDKQVESSRQPRRPPPSVILDSDHPCFQFTDSEFYHNVAPGDRLDDEIMNALYPNETILENNEENEDDDETQAPDLDDTPTSPLNNPSDAPVDPPVETPTFNREPAKRLETSLVWNFFTQVREKNKAKCKTCGKLMSHKYVGDRSGTGSLTRHIKTHPRDKARFFQMKAHLEGTSVDSAINPSTGSNLVQPGINTVTGGILYYDPNRDREELAKMITVMCLPYTFASNPNWVHYIRRVFNPTYKGWPRATVKSDIYKFKHEYEQYLRYLFTHIPNRISITTDIGRSGNDCDYLTVTSHWIDEEWIMQKRIIAYRIINSRHTGKFIANTVADICRYFCFSDKIMAISMDNASSNTSAIGMLTTTLNPAFTNIFHVRCICHIYHLIVGDGMRILNIEIEKVRMALNWLFYSNRRSRLREYFKKCDEYGLRERKVPKPCPTRWNCMYESLVVAYEYRNPINATFNSRVGGEDDDEMLTTQDWTNVKILLDFLEHFQIATNAFSGQYYPTISNCLVYIAALSDLFVEFSEGGDIYELAINEMKQKFKKYFFPIPPIYGLAAMLNPTMKLGGPHFWYSNIYKALDLSNEEIATLADAKASIKINAQTVYNAYQLALEHARPTIPTPTSSSSQSSKRVAGLKALKSWTEFRGSQGENYDETSHLNELQVYLSQGLEKENPDGSFDLLEWWKAREKHFPVLARMARDILSIQASTVASESAFSQARLQIGDHRASMRDSLEKSVLFRDWIRSERRNFGIAEAQPAIDEAYEEMIAELAEDSASPGSGDEQASFPPPPTQPPPNLEGFMRFVRDNT